MEHGFGLFDAEDRIILHNAAFLDEGSRAEFGNDVTARTFEDIVRAFVYRDMPVEPGFDREAWIAQRMQRHRNPPPHPIEVPWGRDRWMRISERRTADGGYVGIWTDISAQKARQAQLEAAKEDLERQTAELAALARELTAARNAANEANLSKSRFLANMSHELRTPLNAINGFSELILLEQFGPVQPPKYREFVQFINSSGEHLLSLINDLLDLSKIEAGKVELHVEPVEITEAARAALEGVRLLAAERGVALRADLDADCAKMHADPRALRQVLLNLMSNAVRFTPEGGMVRISAAAHPDGVDIAVADTGIGMTPEDIREALEVYGQVRPSLGGVEAGTGLGLPLVKALMELHGGSLALTSEKGRGTIARVRFPWQPDLTAKVA